ncbi:MULTISPECIES: hypothetical protein [Pandoraea]|uniref:hypothetical protein n=1 Tax=Pandoraea TaxID=93217 RepID=UPI001F5CC01F|nr:MULTISPECIES: hypothetical protein [Pandoraea]
MKLRQVVEITVVSPHIEWLAMFQTRVPSPGCAAAASSPQKSGNREAKEKIATASVQTPVTVFSLSSEATAEGKFGRATGNTGIRRRQPAVGSGQPPSSLLRGKPAVGDVWSQSMNTR